MALGPELITNGAFDSGAGWSLLNGSTISGGIATIVANGSVGSDFPNWVLEQSNILPQAEWNTKEFVLTFDARQTVGTGNLQVAQRFYLEFDQAVTGTFETYTVRFGGYYPGDNASGNDLIFGGSTSGDEFEIDNVSLKEEIKNYDAEAIAFIDAVQNGGDRLSIIQRDAIDNLVKGLKANGTWGKYKAIYPFIGGTADAHKYNLKDPTQFTITWSGTITHNSNGATSDGTTGYGDTNLLPSTDLTHGTNHISAYCIASTTTNGRYEIGAGEFNASQLRLNLAFQLSWNFSHENLLQGAGTTVAHGGNQTGYLISSRISHTDTRLYHNGAEIGTVDTTDTSSTNEISSSNITVLSNNFAGTPSGYSDRTLGMATIGDGLTDQEVADDYTVIETYQDSLGRGVTNNGFESEYSAVISEAIQQGYTLPTLADQIKQNNIVKYLKEAGIWTTLDRFYWFRDSGDDDFKSIDWTTPTATKATYNGTYLSRPITTAEGWEGYGNTNNTHVIPHQTALVNHLSTGSGFTVWDLTGNRGTDNPVVGAAGGDVLFGVSTSITTFLCTASSGITSLRYWDVDTFVDFSENTSKILGGGFDGSQVQAYKDGATLGSPSSTGLSTTNNVDDYSEWHIGNGSIYDFNGIIGFFAIGGNYSQADMYTAVMSAENGFEPEYQAILTEATTQGYTLPSATWQARHNEMVRNLKEKGLWSSIDHLFVYQGDSPGQDFKFINWINPAGAKGAIAGLGTDPLTWDEEGVTGSAVDTNGAGINSNFNLSTDGTNYLQNDAGIYVDIINLSQTANRHEIYGGSSGGDYNISVDTILMRPKINSDGSLGPLFTIDTAGLYGASRENATQQIHGIEGNNSTVSHNSGALQNETIYFLGAGPFRGDGKIRFSIISSSLVGSEQDIIDSLRYPYFEVEYQAILDEARSLGYTLPTFEEQENQNAILADMKSTGVWYDLDCFYWFKHSGSSDFKLINWKDPSGTKATEFNFPTFNTNGVQGNGTSAYIDTNINQLNTINYGTQNAFASMEAVNVGASGGNAFGCSAGVPILLLTTGSGNNQLIESNTLPYSVTTSGVISADTDSSNAEVWKDGVFVAEDTTIATGFTRTSGTFQILRRGSGYSDATIGFVAIGGLISHTDFYNAVDLYIATEPGAQVLQLTGDTPLSIISTGDLTAYQVLALSGNVNLLMAVDANASLKKQLQGATALSVDSAGDIVAKVSLTGDTDINITAGAQASLRRSLSGDVDLSLISAGDLLRLVSITGDTFLTIDTSGDLTLQSANVQLQGNVDLSLISNQPELKTKYSLDGDTALILDASGSLNQKLSLIGNAILELSTNGDLGTGNTVYLTGNAILDLQAGSAETKIIRKLGGDVNMDLTIQGALSSKVPLVGDVAMAITAAGSLRIAGEQTLVQAWNGSQWVYVSIFKWTGTQWASATFKYWDGTQWITS
jgi:hypothetical protein